MKIPVNLRDNINKKDKIRCITIKKSFIIRIRRIMETIHNKEQICKIRAQKNKLNRKMDKNQLKVQRKIKKSLPSLQLNEKLTIYNII